MSQSNTRLARVRTARRPHVSRASANARGRGVARIVVVGSELEFEPRLATSPLARAGPSRVGNHRTRIRRGLFEGAARAFLETKARRRGIAASGHVPTFKVLPPGRVRAQNNAKAGSACLTYITTVRLRVLKAAFDCQLPARHENAAHAGDAIG